MLKCYEVWLNTADNLVLVSQQLIMPEQWSITCDILWSTNFSTHCTVWMLDFVRFFEKFIGTEMAVLPAVPLFVEKLWLHPSFCSIEVQWCVIEFFETGFDCNSWWPNTANELAFDVKCGQLNNSPCCQYRFVRLTERIESWSIQECCIWLDSSKLSLCYRLPHSLLRSSYYISTSVVENVEVLWSVNTGRVCRGR